MLKSLSWKLILAFALVAFTTAALVALFIRLTSANRLMQLVVEQQRNSLQQILQNYYSLNGSWDNIANNWENLQSLVLPTPEAQLAGPPPQENRPPGGSSRRNFLGLADAQGIVLVSVDPKYPAGSELPADILSAGTPVMVDSEQVGTILTAQEPPGFNSQEAQFLKRTTEALIFAGLGALLVALTMGILLARTLTRPLHALTQAAQSITQGQLEQQVEVKTDDEIGQLAVAFNRMSQEVARVNLQRKQMTADIAHDLRTPLTVISGYIESMRDGDLKPTPERLALIYTEIERMQTLVGDLRTLSLADAGELSLYPQALSPKTLLERAAAVYRHQAGLQGVEIRIAADEDLPEVQADESRMMQVLDNLISNALRYTSPGGVITLCAQVSNGKMEFCVQDTGEGIPEEELSQIFNRFHRADKSRHTESGESGLGLAIVKALVEAHGGSVTAESTPGGGTAIYLILPLELHTIAG
jgi:signal transduction histidine kinase